MPVKPAKKFFQRRKSSNNVLDTVPPPSGESSFKVIPRPHSSAKSFDGGSTLQVAPTAPAKASFEDGDDMFSVLRGETKNRDSGATSNSLSTAHYDSAASSSRLSTTSTNPSSVDTKLDKNNKGLKAQSQDAAPPPPPPAHSSRPNFLKNASRTFSMGLHRGSKVDISESSSALPEPASTGAALTNARDRAMTTSSVTTTAPPRIDEHTFSIKDDNDDFASMFAKLNTKRSRDNLSSTQPSLLRSAYGIPQPPSHTRVDTTHNPWSSPGPEDPLFSAPSPDPTVTQNSPYTQSPRQALRRADTEDDNMFEDTPLRVGSSNTSKPPMSPVKEYAPSSYQNSVKSRNRTQSSATETIRSTKREEQETEAAFFDPSLLANAQLATQFEKKQAAPPTNKVMTPKEFERYKQQKEETRKYNKVFGKASSDDGSGDDYEDDGEDEREREKAAVSQRKKQEAHLAVYRQQMMKVTGNTEPQPDLKAGPDSSPQLNGSSSQLDMPKFDSRRMSQLTLGGKESVLGGGTFMDEPEEDEDVPLGILAAHGFPNKNRPPQQLTESSSNPNLRQIAQIQGGTAAPGTSIRGLPAFARNLPADPYYGASIHNQPERAPMGMHQSPSQMYLAQPQPQPSGAATGHPLHPAGLVGVIAGEEKARAMRRGNTNPQGVYNMPQGMMPPQQPLMSASEQAQLQMSQSMTQMMQMQMQWMQQMSSMMQQNPGMPMPQMPGMPQMSPGITMTPPPAVGPQRPQSVPLQGVNGAPLRQSRTMSSLSPAVMDQWQSSRMNLPQLAPVNFGSTYAPSVAPSERSNVGLASRYRPVSTVSQSAMNIHEQSYHSQLRNQQNRQLDPMDPQANASKRSSTFTSSTYRPQWQNENNLSYSGATKSGLSTIRNVQVPDDDDEESGWAEMKAKREKKKMGWKLRRGKTEPALQEVVNGSAH